MSGEPVTSAVISKWIILTMWAAFGGATHALVEKRKGRLQNFVDGLILCFISGFAGMMWGLLALKFYPNDILIVAFASGIGGFMSLEGLAMIIQYLKDRILVNKSKDL